jgi:iron transport multicopper oxidase
MIVHDPAAPYTFEIDEEIVLTLSDWYHDQALPLIRLFQSPINEELHEGSQPVLNAILINETQNVHFDIKLNRNYLFCIINMGAFAAQYLEFDQHDVDVAEIDGVYTQSHRISQLYLPVAQRYSVILKSKSTTNQNFAIVASMDLDMFDPGVTPPNIPNKAGTDNID